MDARVSMGDFFFGLRESNYVLRSSEWFVLAYFAYAAVAGATFGVGIRPWLLLAAIAVLLFLIARRGKSVLRDLAPVGYTLAGYREMNWFAPPVFDHHLENAWIIWDRRLLDSWHLRAAIESLGFLLPSYLELCYLLVYGVAAVGVWLMFLNRKRDQVDRFWLGYLVGTLGVYAMFPYFPSEPPRTVFPGADLPHVVTVIRKINLWIVGDYGIHSSVFPSAHVSSAFSAAWALVACIPERKAIGIAMVIYAISVAIATIYGRYHFAVDALAGAAFSVAAIAALRLHGSTPR
jgi:membrane-associated phospholipid phosphatase